MIASEFSGYTIPFANGHRSACVSRDQRQNKGRRGDGFAASGLPDRRYSIPLRVDHDGRGKKSPLELPQHMITDFIQKMIERVDLTEAEARQAMEEVMSGQSTDAQSGGCVTALGMKGETSSELVGFVGVMREGAEPFGDGGVLLVLGQD